MNEKVAEVAQAASKFPVRKIVIGVAVAAVVASAAVLIKRKVDSEEVEETENPTEN